jgi:hypothetical protein
MTEEEARPENTSPGASQPDEKPEGQKSLTDKNSVFPTGTFKFQQTKEQKTMTDAANKPENFQLQAQLAQSTLTPSEAIKQFEFIKKALAGAEPEWCLPKVNEKALASSPPLVEPPLGKCCQPRG